MSKSIGEKQDATLGQFKKAIRQGRGNDITQRSIVNKEKVEAYRAEQRQKQGAKFTGGYTSAQIKAGQDAKVKRELELKRIIESETKFKYTGNVKGLTSYYDDVTFIETWQHHVSVWELENGTDEGAWETYVQYVKEELNKLQELDYVGCGKNNADVLLTIDRVNTSTISFSIIVNGSETKHRFKLDDEGNNVLDAEGKKIVEQYQKPFTTSESFKAPINRWRAAFAKELNTKFDQPENDWSL